MFKIQYRQIVCNEGEYLKHHVEFGNWREWKIGEFATIVEAKQEVLSRLYAYDHSFKLHEIFLDGELVYEVEWGKRNDWQRDWQFKFPPIKSPWSIELKKCLKFSTAE